MRFPCDMPHYEGHSQVELALRLCAIMRLREQWPQGRVFECENGVPADLGVSCSMLISSTCPTWKFLRISSRTGEFSLPETAAVPPVVADAPMLPDLLDPIPSDQEIASVTSDGAFDTRTCHRFAGLGGPTSSIGAI